MAPLLGSLSLVTIGTRRLKLEIKKENQSLKKDYCKIKSMLRMKTLALLVPLLLVSMRGLAQTNFDSQMDAIANKLEEGEVCTRDRKMLRDGLHTCSEQVGDSHTTMHILEGGAIGVIIGVLACSITKICQ